MKSVEANIEFLDTLIVRVPVFPISDLHYSHDVYKQILSNKIFSEALFIANPMVHGEATSWLNGKLLDKRKEKRLKKTLLNYWIRIHTNPVPFGLFSGVTTARWGDVSDIRLLRQNKDVQLDMVVLHAICRQLNSLPIIKKNILYFANNTIYRTLGKIRFNDMSFTERYIQYKLSAIDSDEYVNKVLEKACTGATIAELVASINDEEYSLEEYDAYINELIDSQVIVPELQVNITGTFPLKRMIETLKRVNVIHSNAELEDNIRHLEEAILLLSVLSKPSEYFFINFERLLKHVRQKMPSADPKRLIKVDTYFETDKAYVNQQLKKLLGESVALISALSDVPKRDRFEIFIRKFKARYEDAFMPLMEVIDTENGISYGDFNYQSDNIFLESQNVSSSLNEATKRVSENKAKLLLYKKYMECITNGKPFIEFNEKECSMLEGNIDKMASTGLVHFNYIDADTDTIALITTGNSSAGNLISRFANNPGAIQDALIDIAAYEKQSYPNAIVAEIVHIPEHIIGNISFRPLAREFEIPIATNSVLSASSQIPLSDLYVGIRNNQIALMSVKHGKQVIPKLTNAHNHIKRTLSVYQFLSDLAYQDILPNAVINTGVFHLLGKYIPRIQYKNAIITKATWVLQKEDLKELFDKSASISHEDIMNFREKWKIPEATTFHFSIDNPTYIDWNSTESVSSFLETVKDWDRVTITEFPFNNEHALLRDSSGKCYFNELIALYKNKARKNWEYTGPFFSKNLKRNFQPGEEWVYLKVYCGLNSYYQLMNGRVANMVVTLRERRLINEFFFLPYTDPEFHLRIRFHCPEELNRFPVIQYVLSSINEENSPQKIVLDTYQQEVERYGPTTMKLAERIFSVDSSYILANHNFLLRDNAFMLPLLVLNQIDEILEAFGLADDLKLLLLQNLHDSYSLEFNIDGNRALKDQINEKIGLHRLQIEQALEDNIFEWDGIDSQQYLASLKQYQDELVEVYVDNRAIFDNSEFALSFLPGILHMHCIRCFPLQPRLNELYIYTALYRYYVKNKYKKSSEEKPQYRRL